MSQTLAIRRSSASLRGEKTGIRELPVVAKYIDTTTCIGCKACEVACQEWNDLPTIKTEQVGSYQTLPGLDANFWNLIKFQEQEVNGSVAWLMRKDQCMHCDDPGCLEACPAPGAIVQYANGIVDVNAEACIGCGLCATGCPFDVPRFSARTGKMSKCTLCVDRVTAGIEPACIKACPTGCLQFGPKTDMVALGNARVQQLHANGFPDAMLYDPEGVGGTGVVTVLGHGAHPEWYSLPKNPTIPTGVSVSKKVLKPLGVLAILGTVAGSVGYFLRFGPKVPPEGVEPLKPIRGASHGREDTVLGDQIVRHGALSRFIHWTAAITFIGALLSGLPIWTPIFGWMAYLFGGLAVCRWLHPFLGCAFVVSMLAMVAYWLRDMKMTAADRGWFGPKAIAYFRDKSDDPESGKYNGGQKIYFYTGAILAILLVLSGIPLWFPMEFTRGLREASWLVHDVGFILFVVAMIGHAYLSTSGVPGSFRSMTRGMVTKTWARHHHPRWYADVTSKSPGGDARK
jgi:formate dehydrogenase beta subunit/formate dehydrogenase gamma subunit